MEFLEGFGHRLLTEQFFGAFAEYDLSVEVLLHVEVTQLAVDVDLVEEFLHQEVVGVPEVGVFGSRHLTDGFPSFLECAELVVGLFEGLLRSDQLFEFFEDGAFLQQVFLFLLVDDLILARAVGLEDAESGVEAFFGSVRHMLVALFVATAFDEGFQFLVEILFVEFHKTDANGGHLVLDLGDIGLLDKFLEHGGQFFLGFSFDIQLNFFGFFQFILFQLSCGHDFRKHLVLGDDLLRGLRQGLHFDAHATRKDGRLVQFHNSLFLIGINGLKLFVFHFNQF